MLIDFHTHAFADEIAEKAIATLSENGGIPCYTDGTISGARELFLKQGVDAGVLLPIATKPTQQVKINDWAISFVGDKTIIPFGTVHPDAPESEIIAELHRIKKSGLKGIKLHPDYQNSFLFEPKMNAIYRTCEELELPIVFHMGYDPFSPYVRHASPYHLIEINERYPKLKLIGGHLGGMYAWEEVLRYLCGRNNIWLDTAFLAGYIEAGLFMDIIRAHGVNRILFASDCPWHEPKQEVELIEKLPLSEEEREMIYWKNARELLGN